MQVLGKTLTERLLRDYHHHPAPVCIVRPTLVSALAGPPYPGFTGNLAGALIKMYRYAF
jgi:fatty acyl-CoA reductase